MIRRTTTSGIITATILLLAGCGDRGAEPPKHPPEVDSKRSATSTRSIQPPPAVRDRLRTEPVTLHPIPEVVTAPGEVALDLKQVAKITSRIEGQVEQIHVQLGDRVKPSQPLAAIGSLQLDQLIEEYLVGKAQANVAENSFRRTEKLRADDIVPERKLIEDKGRYLETKARYQHTREKLVNMGLSISELTELERGRHQEGHRYTLTSPIAGTVVAQNAVRGQGVAPGNELFEVVDTSRVWVFANLSIEQARKFKEGDTGTITPKGAKAMTAPLTYLAPVADETTRTIQVRFEVANPQGQLKPREYVDVTLTLPGSPTLAVPVSAVTTADKIRGVFIEQESAYTFMPIDIGREGGGWVEVRKGVKRGDRVVIEGVFDLKNVLLKEHIGTGD
ncbi:MAG: cation efflux system protein CzcB [Nitrospira sp.]|nr:MAG: cation efflux system protein CzcB [Nitrospira sp.]